MARITCSVCKAALKSATLPEISGEEGRLAVAVHRLPVLECPNGHRQFTNPDFPLLLLDRLTERDEAGLPASAAKGVLFRHFHCASCGERLPDAEDAQHTFHVDVALPEIAPFDVELTMPVHRCAHCGRVQLHSLKEVRSRTPAALAHAFKSAHIAAG